MNLSSADSLTDSDIARLCVTRDAINRRLGALLDSGEPTHMLPQAMRYALLAPGKRLRPLLTVLAATALDANENAALDAACALEMVHTASLILDDLPSMDNAALRRGQPTTHLAFGEDVAILASISLLSRSFGVVASTAGLPGSVRADLVSILAHATGARGLCGGQLEDLRHRAQARQIENGQTEQIAAVNQLKTGMLFLAAVDMAATIGRAAAEQRAALRDFAENLGWAFQLHDDLLDGAASPLLIGKDVGRDHGKSTMVSALGRGGTRIRLQRHIADALESLASLGTACHQLHVLVRATFGAEAARAQSGCIQHWSN